jgi:cytosine/adenosine deaminase-related metal-dependent hydrolase
MIIAADVVLKGNGDVLHHGAVRVKGDTIVECAPLSEISGKSTEPVLHLKESVLSPGFVNAHCHLDYQDFKGVIPPQKSFTEWIKRINALKRDFSNQDYCEAIHHGYQSLLRTGTTSVLNIAAMPEVFPYLSPPPLRVWWFLELVDIRSRLGTDEALIGVLFLLERCKKWLGGVGLSPHAPYTASVPLYRYVRRCADAMNLLVSTHVAESREEQEMFVYGKGRLYEFLEKLGRDMHDCGQGSALSSFWENGVMTSEWILAHLNYLQEYDFEILKKVRPKVVHCPRCHSYFGHQRFEMERLESMGILVALGTDSLASNQSLDLRSEVRQARHQYEHKAPIEWWRMMTSHGAWALKQEGRLGVIQEGALADLVAFPLSDGSDYFEQIIQYRGAPTYVMVNGKTLSLEEK